MSADLPLYCGGCNEVHHLTWHDVERIVYALQCALIDETVQPSGYRPYAEGEPDCLLRVLVGTHDGEVYKEWSESIVECRETLKRVDCPLHLAGAFYNDDG